MVGISQTPVGQAIAIILLSRYDVPVKLPYKHLCLCLQNTAAVNLSYRGKLFFCRRQWFTAETSDLSSS